MAWLTGWNYRKVVTISNTGSTLSDYQVLITADTASLVTAGKMRPDCGDIRFTDTDGSTLLSYWIESGINTVSTKIWVKIPSVPTGTKTIYLYYGNSLATSVSNGVNTFPFFDHFLGSVLDSKWYQIDTGGTTTVGSSIVTVSGGSLGDWIMWRSSNAPRKSIPFILEGYAKFTSETGDRHSVFRASSVDGSPWDSDTAEFAFYSNDPNKIYRTQNNNIYTNIARSSNLTVWTRMKIVLNGTNVRFYENDVLKATSTSNIPDSQLGVAFGTANPGAGISIDWVFIREYTSPEPIFSTGIEEVSGAPVCPIALKYEGDTVHLSATPKDGIGPYTVIFKKNNIPISSLSNVIENTEVIYDHILTNDDILNATLGTIDFSVYIEDSCPTTHQTCEQICTINIGCIAPVCNFQVT